MIFARPSRSSSPSGPEQSRGSRKTPFIAVTGFRGIPATWGGVEHQCEEIYTRLASKGYRVTVYARSHYVREGLQTYKGVTVKRFWTLNTKYTEAILHTLFSVLHILGSNPEIVHLYSQGPCLFIPLVKLFRPRMRVFFTCVGLDWKRKKWPGWASRIIRLGELFSARFPDHHITVSRELQDYYRAEYGVKAFYIPNGVSTPERITLEEVEHHSLQPRGYFLFVGRLVPEKRVEDLIRAFLAKPRRSRLVIAGDAAGTEDYVRYLRSIAATSSSVLFVGYQYGRALGALYSNARAFVTTSELEGMPLTLLEALSHGLFCLASDIPPHREVLEGTAHSLFPVGSVESLSSHLDQLDTMESLQLESYETEARNHVATHFSWDVVVDQLEDLYVRSVAAGKVTGAAPW